jgi:hypothetical protein
LRGHLRLPQTWQRASRSSRSASSSSFRSGSVMQGSWPLYPKRLAGISLNLLLLSVSLLSHTSSSFYNQNLQTSHSSIGPHSDTRWTSGAMFLILGCLIRPILRGKDPGIERGDLHPVLFRRFRVAMFFYAFIGSAYLVSALPFFWIDTPIGPSWVCLLVLRLRRPRNIESRTRENSSSQTLCTTYK